MGLLKRIWNALLKWASLEEPQLAGPVSVTVTQSGGPPLLCAWEREQVDNLTNQLQAILIALQTAVEALAEREESTIPPAMLENFEVRRGNIKTAIKYMIQNAGAVQYQVKRMQEIRDEQ